MLNNKYQIANHKVNPRVSYSISNSNNNKMMMVCNRQLKNWCSNSSNFTSRKNMEKLNKKSQREIKASTSSCHRNHQQNLSRASINSNKELLRSSYKNVCRL